MLSWPMTIFGQETSRTYNIIISKSLSHLVQVHPFNMLQAEEDTGILARGGHDTMYNRIFNIDKYVHQQRQMTTEQKAEMYHFHKKQLQMIFWHDPDYDAGRLTMRAGYRDK